MLCHGNRGKHAGKRKIRKSRSICPKLVDGSVGRKLPADSAKTQWSYDISWMDDMNSGGSVTERP